MRAIWAKCVLAVGLMVVTNTASAVNVSGTLPARDEPYVWDDTSEPYVLTGHLTVDPGATLEIRPGVQVVSRRYEGKPIAAMEGIQ